MQHTTNIVNMLWVAKWCSSYASMGFTTAVPRARSAAHLTNQTGLDCSIQSSSPDSSDGRSPTFLIVAGMLCLYSSIRVSFALQQG